MKRRSMLRDTREGGGLGGEPQAGGEDLERGGPESAQETAQRGRLWLTDGSCIRLRPLYRHHNWAYDFVADRYARRSNC